MRNFSNLWLFGIPALALSGAILFIHTFADASKIFTIQGTLGFLIYSLLSVITGLRYRFLISEIKSTPPDVKEVITVPAAMNLMSFILPFKGGGLWLLFFLKIGHGIDFVRASWLAVINLILIFSVLISILLADIYLHTASFLLLLILAMLIFLVCNMLTVLIHNRFWKSSKAIRMGWAANDTLLVSIYLLLLFTLALLISPVKEPEFLLFIIFSTLISLSIKITPGNIGILEGIALTVGQYQAEYADAFILYVATYRIFSLAHAVGIGLPSLLNLMSGQQIRKFYDYVKDLTLRR